MHERIETGSNGRKQVVLYDGSGRVRGWRPLEESDNERELTSAILHSPASPTFGAGSPFTHRGFGLPGGRYTGTGASPRPASRRVSVFTREIDAILGQASRASVRSEAEALTRSLDRLTERRPRTRREFVGAILRELDRLEEAQRGLVRACDRWATRT